MSAEKMLSECRAHWEKTKPDAVFADYWIGWQASRESLVIELPIPKELCGPDGSYMEYFEPEQIERAIEAAGLKVKS